VNFVAFKTISARSATKRAASRHPPESLPQQLAEPTDARTDTDLCASTLPSQPPVSLRGTLINVAKRE
jgi:hypothetical protein